jgi:CheY-like chemotaxis protein
MQEEHEMSKIDFSTWKILAVDDEPDNLSLLGDILNFSDAEVVTARSGEQAIALLDQQTFSLALIDIQMPGVSGWDVIQHIRNSEREELRKMLVIAVTAFAMLGDKERVLAAGFDGYMSKPIDAETFMLRIEAIVQEHLPASPPEPTPPPAEAREEHLAETGANTRDAHENSAVQP